MKITRKQLKQLIKEEMTRINEDPVTQAIQDFSDVVESSVKTFLRGSLEKLESENDDVNITEQAIEDVLSNLDDGVFTVSGFGNLPDPVITFGAVIDLESLENSLDALNLPDDITFVDEVMEAFTQNPAYFTITEKEIDEEFGQGASDALKLAPVSGTFASASELRKIISQKMRYTPTDKKPYSGPKGKGQDRYIVTSQMTSWNSEDEANFTQSWFRIVDTTDSSEFKLKGSELPYVLPSSLGEIEIFDIVKSNDRDKSNLVASLNNKEFHLARKDI